MYFNFHNFYNTNLNIKQSEEYDKLLSWILGFMEGDGSWQVDEKCHRNYFIINQKDPKVLYKVKSILQCGKVRQYENIYRFTISDQKGTFKIIQLCNGNLILNKTKLRLIRYIEIFNKTEKKNLKELEKSNIQFISNDLKPTLEDGWLSGFIDGEGYFDMEKGENLRFSLVQYDEYPLFLHLSNLFDLNVTISKNKQLNNKVYYRINFTKLESIIKLLLYLDEYRLYTNKNISIIRCKKILIRKLDDVDRINKPRAIKRYNRLKKILNLLNEDNLDKK